MPTTGSLYFHIPFCTKKCPYCHFFVLPNKKEDHTILAGAIDAHLEETRDVWEKLDLVSIYFGGGTPSLFDGIGEILKKLPSASEITIEANPEEADEKLFEKFLKWGINRLSLGVQSLDDRALNTLERTHTATKAKDAIRAAKFAGFQNITIDLMYDLPDQTLSSWHYTLDQLDDLPISHLSLYNLTIEPHTAFHKRGVQPSSGNYLEPALHKFDALGLKRYEISAFAKPGFESKHNLGYWQGRPFLGFGPSAFSYFNGSRFRNTMNLRKYAQGLREDFRETLPYPQNIKELLAIALRVRTGINLNQWQLPQETQDSLKKLEEMGLIERNGDALQMTERGMLVYDSIAEELI